MGFKSSAISERPPRGYQENTQLASNSLPLSHLSSSKRLIYVDLARDAFIPECPFSSSAFKTSTLKNVLDRIRYFADPLDYLGRNGRSDYLKRCSCEQGRMGMGGCRAV
jgi:hypothetical protein